MKRLKYATSVMAVVVLVVAVVGLGQVIAAPTAATVSFASPTTVAPGGTFSVTINVQVDEGINGATTSFTYDTTCFDATGFTQPSPDGLDMSLGTSIDDTTGTVTVNEGKLIGSVTGSVDVLIVDFTVDAGCPLGDQTLAFGGPANMIVDAATSTEVDPTTWVDGVVTIDIEPPDSIGLAPATQTIEACDTADLIASVVPITWTGQVEFSSSAGVVSPTMAALDGSGQAMTTLSDATAAGTVVVTATASTETATAEVVVTACMTDPPASVDLTPKDATAMCQEVVAYTLMATDTYGNDWDATALGAAFAIDTGAGGSWAANSYTADLEGTWNVTGTLSGVSDSTTLIVSAGAVASVDVVVSPITVTAGQSVTATATAMDACGNTWDVTSSSTFTVTGGGSCVGSTCTPTGAGTQTVTVTYDGFSDDVTVTVNPDMENPVSVDLTPDAATVTAGDTQDYMLTAYDTYGNDWDVTISATLDIDVGAGGSWTDNSYTSENVGDWTVTGSYDVFSDTATLSVDTAPYLVANISAPVAGVEVDLDENTQFTVTATISNTGEADATGVSATLAVVGDVTFVSSATQTVGDVTGGGVSSTINWTLECGSTGDVTVTVTPAGNDANSGMAITGLDPDTVAFSQVSGFYIYLPIVMKNN